MTIHQFVFNPYQVNTYIISADNGQCIIIDPACCSPEEQEILKNYISGKNLSPAWLVNTHGHFDHVIGNAFINNNWEVKKAAHKEDFFLLQNAYRQGEIFGFPVEQPPIPELMLKDGDIIELDDILLNIYHIPGHSPGSIVLYSPTGQWVVSGDVLFNGSIGRTDLPGGDYDQLIHGIRTKLLALPQETMVYPGHGPETSIGQELIHNPFLNGQ